MIPRQCSNSSPKQIEAVQAVNAPTVDALVLLGVVGSGKTDVAAHIDLTTALSFPKTYWPVFRKNTFNNGTTDHRHIPVAAAVLSTSNDVLHVGESCHLPDQ